MEMEKSSVNKLMKPIQRFIKEEKSGGIVLGISVLLALVLANSPLSSTYFHFFENQLGLYFNGTTYLNNTLHHWINDGLMAVFFFVVGLELKREMVNGELSNPRKALLPIVAAFGGMIVPAGIYLLLNPTGEVHQGWGIPMATDIAFALGVLYLLGSRIPLSLKIFLTALAIVDDLGAVLVIAFFYTSDISFLSLGLGLGFVLLMFLGNKMGVRNILFYAVLGILGVWVSFLLSGVHATIAAVLAAFTIPADIRLKESVFVDKVHRKLQKFQECDAQNEQAVLTGEQIHLLEKIKENTNAVIPPLQRLEHAMHPFVAFVVLPVFALANAGVSLSIDMDMLFSTNVLVGVALGLLIGKVVGVVGFTWLFVKLKMASFPKGMTFKSLLGLSFLASIGFTMSLFIASLAFTDEVLQVQAKVGIFSASIVGGVLGYLILKSGSKRDKKQ